MLDLLGHLRWANDLPFYVVTNFGIQIPLLIPFCYAAFLGLEPYFIYELFKRGLSVKQVMLVYLIAGTTDAIMETPGLLLHVYQYYGVQPYTFLEFPYWWAFINGASFMTIGFFIWYLEPRLKGWGRALFLVLPPVGMMVAYFSVGWVHILALNSTLPTAAKWLATTIMMAGFILYIRGMAYFVAVPEEEAVDWHLGQLLTYRLLAFLPSARQRMLDDEARGIASQKTLRHDENERAHLGGRHDLCRGGVVLSPATALSIESASIASALRRVRRPLAASNVG
jgi:hypothetical protein